MLRRLAILWGLMRGQRRWFIAAIIATLLATGLMYLRPFQMQEAIDTSLDQQDPRTPWFIRDAVEAIGGREVLARNLWIVMIGVVTTSAVSNLFRYLRGLWSARASETMVRRLREEVYDSLQHLSCSYFDKAETGDLVQRCTSDVATLQMFLGHHLVEMFSTIVLIAVGVPVLLSLHPTLGLVSVCLIPVLVGFASIFFFRISRQFKRTDEAEGAMTSRIQENLSGIRVVRAFARQDHERERFAKANNRYITKWRGLVNLFAVYWGVSEVICLSQTGLALFFAAYLAMRGEITVGKIYAVMACIHFFLWPVRHFGRTLSETGKALVAIERIQAILDQPVESDEGTVAIEPGRRLQGAITLNDVHFAHGDGANVLKGVSFEVKPGQTIAILGPSGSGKTTLVSLLLRFYDYDAGSIRLDGTELKQLPRKYVRGQIGVVLQDPFLYSRTVGENIRLGAAASPQGAVEAAASAACVHESVMEFEHGYDTVVGERGVTLSGGQRQRVALARAMLNDPPILALDDALSAVDTRTESMILDALAHRHGRRTTLIIAHRLTTLRRADHILVLDDGRVAQAGTHEQLLTQEGVYSRLWRIQSELDEELTEEIRLAAGASRMGGGS